MATAASSVSLAASRGDLLGQPPWEPVEAVREGPEDTPSECLMGTLTEVNQKIVSLEQEFEEYHSANMALKHLEFSKRYSEQKSSRQEKKFPETPKEKDKSRRETCGFMQKYGHALRESDVDVLPQSTSEQGTVEMYQYPGYNKDKLTPLPSGIELTDVVEKTLRAQRKSSSGKTLLPRNMLRNFLLAPVSQAILVDSFWWLFLHLYQPDQEIEEQLFDRIAKNYAFLLLDYHRFHHQEACLKVFPSLLSQALYICFCSGFPKSCFNTDEFKTQLCNVISEWIAGTLPVPRSYTNWNYSQLEPERFKINNLQAPKGKHRSHFFKANSSPEKANRHCLPRYKVKQLIAITYDQRFYWYVKPCAECGKTFNLRQERKHGQASIKYQPQQTSKVIKSKQAKLKAVTFPDLQTPDAKLEKDQMESAWKESQHMLKTRRLKIAPHPRESHPACRGPDFTWHLFNISGRSPLIHHFLQSCNAEPRSGQDILIHRREISNPIPASTPTYADLIQEGFRHIHTMDAAFKEVYHRHCREIKAFDQRQQKEKQEFLRKKKQLLQENREQKNLKQLLHLHPIVFCNSEKISEQEEGKSTGGCARKGRRAQEP